MLDPLTDLLTLHVVLVQLCDQSNAAPSNTIMMSDPPNAIEPELLTLH